MGSITRTFAALLALALAGPAAKAATLDPYTSFWALGDSLSDPGNLYRASRGLQPASPPYFAGRFSNGPVWAEYVADEFRAAGKPAGSLAFGGAQAETDRDPVPDLPAQTRLLALGAAGDRGDRPLVSIWAGANDLMSRGIPSGEAAAVGRSAARSVGANARALADLGVGDLLIFNLPDLGRVPLYALSGDAAARAEASRGSTAFNRTLDRQIAGLERRGVNVIAIDTASLFEDLLANPTDHGVSDATRPCLAPGQTPCTPDEALARAFFDPVHPNSVIHREIADRVHAEIAPVPLPAPAGLLLAGLGALVLLSRRPRARRAP